MTQTKTTMHHLECGIIETVSDFRQNDLKPLTKVYCERTCQILKVLSQNQDGTWNCTDGVKRYNYQMRKILSSNFINSLPKIHKVK